MSNFTYLPGLVLVLVAVVSAFRIPGLFSGIIYCAGCSADNGETYSYRGSRNGPSQWATLFPKDCNGSNQSPININTTSTVKDGNLPKLVLINYDVPIQMATMVNNGHTVQLMPNDTVRRTIVVEGDEYDLAQFHFHWGAKSYQGSEHTIDYKAYAMEVHFVHIASDGRVAVVGVFFKEKKDNEGLKPIINSLPKVMYKNDRTTLQSRLVLNNLLPKNPASYYRYYGSLTTPNCTEGVIWSVIPETVLVGPLQMKIFRDLHSTTKAEASNADNQGCLIAPNFRPIQPLNGRQVLQSE